MSLVCPTFLNTRSCAFTCHAPVSQSTEVWCAKQRAMPRRIKADIIAHALNHLIENRLISKAAPLLRLSQRRQLQPCVGIASIST